MITSVAGLPVSLLQFLQVPFLIMFTSPPCIAVHPNQEPTIDTQATDFDNFSVVRLLVGLHQFLEIPFLLLLTSPLLWQQHPNHRDLIQAPIPP